MSGRGSAHALRVAILARSSCSARAASSLAYRSSRAAGTGWRVSRSAMADRADGGSRTARRWSGRAAGAAAARRGRRAVRCQSWRLLLGGGVPCPGVFNRGGVPCRQDAPAAEVNARFQIEPSRLIFPSERIHFEPQMKLLPKRRTARLRSARKGGHDDGRRQLALRRGAAPATRPVPAGPARQPAHHREDSGGTAGMVRDQGLADRDRPDLAAQPRRRADVPHLRRAARPHRSADGPRQGNQGQGLVARLRGRDPRRVRRLHRPGGGSL